MPAPHYSSSAPPSQDFLCTVWLGGQSYFCGSAGKESTCNAGDLGSIPGLGRSPGDGKDYPFQYSGLENSMDFHGVTKSRTWLSDFRFHFGAGGEEASQALSAHHKTHLLFLLGTGLDHISQPPSQEVWSCDWPLAKVSGNNSLSSLAHNMFPSSIFHVPFLFRWLMQMSMTALRAWIPESPVGKEPLIRNSHFGLCVSK